jgi:hypothetical protein
MQTVEQFFEPLYIAPKNTKSIISKKKNQKKRLHTMGQRQQQVVAVVFMAVVVLRISKEID